MSTAAPPAERPTSRKLYRLRVSSYDRASSLLFSLLVMAVVVVLALAIIFFARRFVTVAAPIPVLPFDPGERPLEAALGVAQDIEPPGIEDAPELTEPKLIDTLTALSSQLAAKVAILSDQALDAETEVGRGSGLGDNRTAGGGGGAEEPQREIKFEFADIENYARWYDAFGIELGSLVGNSATVRYASNFGKAQPDVREGPRSAESRFLLISDGALSSLDRQLADKAGISQPNDYLIQCFPNEAYLQLLAIEQQHARDAGKKITDIKRTVFRVEFRGGEFRFVVEDQTYL